jgi:hypothetical protein
MRCQMSFREGRPCLQEARWLVSDTVLPPHACCDECRRAWEALFEGTARRVTVHQETDPEPDVPVVVRSPRG